MIIVDKVLEDLLNATKNQMSKQYPISLFVFHFFLSLSFSKNLMFIHPGDLNNSQVVYFDPECMAFRCVPYFDCVTKLGHLTVYYLYSSVRINNMLYPSTKIVKHLDVFI